MSRDRLDDRAFNKWVGDGKVTSDQTVEKGTNGRPEDEGLGKRGGGVRTWGEDELGTGEGADEEGGEMLEGVGLNPGGAR